MCARGDRREKRPVTLKVGVVARSKTLVAALALSVTHAALAADRLAPHMAILGVRLSDHTFSDVHRILGPAEVRDNGGDAAAHAKAACYVGTDATAVALVSDEEMGGGWLTMFRLVARPELADFTGDPGGGYVVPLAKRPRCAPLAKLSHRTPTAGGLRLGMTRDEVLRLLGSPSYTTQTSLWFSSEEKVRPTQEQSKRLRQQWGKGRYDTIGVYRWVIVEFEHGIVVAARAVQGES
jgi:hypothetical protein